RGSPRENVRPALLLRLGRRAEAGEKPLANNGMRPRQRLLGRHDAILPCFRPLFALIFTSGLFWIEAVNRGPLPLSCRPSAKERTRLSPSEVISRPRRRQSMRIPKVAHAHALMCADHQVRKRPGSAKENEASLAILGIIPPRLRLVPFSFAHNPSCAGEAPPLQAHGRQVQPTAKRRHQDRLILAYRQVIPRAVRQ